MLAREQQFSIFDDESDEAAERLTKVVRNGRRNELLKYVATDLDILEAKAPEDIYKVKRKGSYLNFFVKPFCFCSRSG